MAKRFVKYPPLFVAHETECILKAAIRKVLAFSHGKRAGSMAAVKRGFELLLFIGKSGIKINI